MISSLTIICDIIQKYLGLTNEQIWIYNQKRNIPTDSKLYIVVSMLSALPYSAGKKYDPSTSLSAITFQYVKESIRIDLLSANTDAVDKVYDVIGALSSDYSNEQQNKLGLTIAPKPILILDTSAAEVSRMLFRMTIDIAVLRAYNQTKTSSYYETISQETHTEKGKI